MGDLKVFECFAGYGSQSLALERLSIPHKVVGISEIDKYAIKAYYALHSEDIHNYGDISLINPKDLPEIDLFTYSYPCTDLSLSGKIEGMERGKTRSGLLYECEKLIESCKPKYLLLENVVNLVGSRFKPQFDGWLVYLESLGYVNTWFILNSNEFGIPQSRSRVFCVSILNGKEIDKPEGVNTEEILNVHTILEDSVLEKYYIDSSKYVVPNGEYTGAIRGRYDKNKKIVQQLECRKDLITNTLTTVTKDNVYIKDGRVRYFTEKECFRLMGLTDNEIEKIESVGIPKTKRYKLAGNSIVIPVLMGIFRNLFKD